MKVNGFLNILTDQFAGSYSCLFKIKPGRHLINIFPVDD